MQRTPASRRAGFPFKGRHGNMVNIPTQPTSLVGITVEKYLKAVREGSVLDPTTTEL